MSDSPAADQIQKSCTRQRLIFLLCSVVFSLWVMAMLVMYFTTVYPQRHRATTSTSIPTK